MRSPAYNDKIYFQGSASWTYTLDMLECCTDKKSCFSQCGLYSDTTLESEPHWCTAVVAASTVRVSVSNSTTSPPVLCNQGADLQTKIRNGILKVAGTMFWGINDRDSKWYEAVKYPGRVEP